jgi:hypothetical protein
MPATITSHTCQRCNGHFQSTFDLRISFPDDVICWPCVRREHLDSMETLYRRLKFTCPCDECAGRPWAAGGAV